MHFCKSSILLNLNLNIQSKPFAGKSSTAGWFEKGTFENNLNQAATRCA
jgi:hypothetical protein